MATRPTQSLSGWAASGTIATSILPAEVALGQQAANPIPAAWINLFGAWLGYFDDLSPADDVLAFREWECPDDSAYDFRWSSSVDGSFVGTVHSMGVLADTGPCGIGFSAGGGATASVTFNPVTSTGYLTTDATGWGVGVVVTDPTTPANAAGITVGADSGDVIIYSDYGTVKIPNATEYQSAVTCEEALLPGGGVASVASGATASPDVNGALDVDSNTASSGAIVDVVLGRSSTGSASGTTSTLTGASMVYSGLGGSGGALTFNLKTVAADGTVQTHASGTLTDGVDPTSGTLTLTVSTATIQRGGCWLLTVNGNGTAADVVIVSFGITYNIDRPR